MNMNSKIRFIAEWEECKAILMALPHSESDWNYILDEALEQYHRLLKAFTDAGETVVLLCKDVKQAKELLHDVNNERVIFVKADYNDTWTRDYGFISIETDDGVKALDFGFNGWGLKFASDKDNLINLYLNEIGLLQKNVYLNNRDFTLEGGSIETDGKGTILTTSRCLCSPNRNGGKTKREIEALLQERLGAKNVLWLDYGALAGDDTDSHIDTLARLTPDGKTIVYVGCNDDADCHFSELQSMKKALENMLDSEGNKYKLVELPLPSPIFDEDDYRLPATYANWLITEKNVFVPTYNQPSNDALAIEAIQSVFPSKRVIGVDCNTLIKQHGSLHCATMQIPSGILNINSK